ncbi:TPA: DUF1642 domain-containing protein [Streptococcus suis]|nr:DUF1642 domain-containing protein [Streptococcus suis]
MNKQEAIKRVEQMGEYERFVDEPISKKSVLNIISQIHESQKVVVPNLIGNWIEVCKTSRLGGQLNTALQGPGESFNNSEAINIWLEYPGNQEKFARAWLFGYEVEKEKLYEVTVPHTSNYKNQTQHLVKQGKNWFFCGNDVNRFKYRFTKGQIEAAGFGWVFGCNGVKIVEVDE